MNYDDLKQLDLGDYLIGYGFSTDKYYNLEFKLRDNDLERIIEDKKPKCCDYSLDLSKGKKVKEYLEDNTYKLIKDEDNIDVARSKIKNNIPTIKENVNKIFKENNYTMPYDINYGYNYFPEKQYRGIKYNEGYYESIVITIGEGKGDNWWCVLFPNLCLVDLENNEQIEYKSWVAEKLNKIF